MSDGQVQVVDSQVVLRYRGSLLTLELVMTNPAGCERSPYMDMEEQCKLRDF